MRSSFLIRVDESFIIITTYEDFMFPHQVSLQRLLDHPHPHLLRHNQYNHLEFVIDFNFNFINIKKKRVFYLFNFKDLIIYFHFH